MQHIACVGVAVGRVFDRVSADVVARFPCKDAWHLAGFPPSHVHAGSYSSFLPDRLG